MQSRMTTEELTGAARKLAYSLGIPVYIRAGRICQNGPGIEFLPAKSARPIPLGTPREDLARRKTDETD
jgi:hypothetical protein